MHPAFSVIMFTVASGMGYGLFVLLGLAHLFGFARVSADTALWGGLLSFGLISGGLLSSTLHLANPKNAWRAFFRFRTSWLSREGVFAVIFYPIAGFYLLGVWLKGGSLNGLISFLGLLSVLLALATIFSTGMIYACLRTIRQWNTPLTPANYLLLGLATGSTAFLWILTLTGEVSSLATLLSLVLLLIAALTKAVYYYWIRIVTGATINTATGFTRTKVRLLDTGHTAGTFLTDEFAYTAQANVLSLLKFAVFGLGFLLPVILVGFMATGNSSSWLAWLAMLSSFIGIGIERWLFFAEARHVVNLYHGAQHT